MITERFYSTFRRFTVGLMPDDLPVGHTCYPDEDGGHRPLTGDWGYENDEGGQMWTTTCPNCHVTIEFVERD